ncbi:MAG: CRISPR-associated helicase/endonuclease Cas3, partial [Myxococcota bacterium]
RRRHFRHELASALAMIDQGVDDLATYLVACHHGKVRMVIRSRPTETPPASGVDFALGVHHGDELPETSLGGGVVVPPTVLRLDVMKLGQRNGHLSWAARTSALLEMWGPFRLALMETLVRVADWRASARHSSAEVFPHA